MARVLSPNKQYDGISAGVSFVKGIGETTDPHLIKWFKNHGYEVQEPEAPVDPPIDEEEIENEEGKGAESTESTEEVEAVQEVEQVEQEEPEAPKKRNTRKKSE